MIGNQRAWGFETNFGGLADFAVVKASQLLPQARAPVLGGGRLQHALRVAPRTGCW